MSIDGLRELVQTLDKETMLNCQCVRLLTEEYLAYAGRDSPELVQAASICDVGKMYVSSRILQKESGLSLAEMQIVRLHPYMGWLTAKEYGVPDEVAQIVLFHHGRSPLHLQDIPMGSDEVLTKARMIYTFDAFHAMTSERCYRYAMEPRLAMEIMTEECHREMTFDGSVLVFLKRRYCL